MFNRCINEGSYQIALNLLNVHLFINQVIKQIVITVDHYLDCSFIK